MFLITKEAFIYGLEFPLCKKVQFSLGVLELRAADGAYFIQRYQYTYSKYLRNLM